jgi:hypothetical protein
MKNVFILLIVLISIKVNMFSQTTSYKYDMLNRLVEVSYSGVKTTYQYDKLGNIINKNVIGPEKFQIPLSKGWNMISSYLVPIEPDSLQYLTSDIKGNLIIAKNNKGEVYIPSYDINNIGEWDVTQGYQVYMNKADTLVITGVEVNPTQTPIILSQGWNMISYLRNTSLDCETAFAGLTDNDNLVIVKDNEGNVYIPTYGINKIGNLIPGQGYQIYLLNADVLIYSGD